MANTNTTEIGDVLKKKVCRLVKAAQRSNCEVEKNVIGKNVDVYYEDIDLFGKTKRIVVECKNYDKRLNQSTISSILSDYTHRKSGFDTLVILSNYPPTPSVLTTLDAHEWAIHCTFAEFRARLMDFRGYMDSLRAAFKNDGLDQYYVPVSTTKSESLEKKVLDWIESDSNRPLAILAGYGMGKSSFAIKLASDLAEKIKSNHSGRIPVLLRLGEIYKEQSISGLISKHFCDNYPLRNGFNYELFRELNKQGSFVLILDGFDEMKHAMEFSDFRSNMKEFNTLVSESAKVIILGRPNIFMSDDEKNSVLHGYRKIGVKELHDVEMRDYEEIEVQFFDKNQLEEFVEKYLQYLSKNLKTSRTPQFLSSRLVELLKPEYSELISRPVHARMLVQLALSYDGELNTFTRYDLYKNFIGEIFERENEKSVRKKISQADRIDFMKSVSWYFWHNGGKSSFRISEIPENIFSRHYDEGLEKEAVKRELLVGSLIERKGNEQYYFVHRSFQEFLVAEYIVSRIWEHKDIPALSLALNSEIQSFLLDSELSRRFVSTTVNAMDRYQGCISNQLASILCTHYRNEPILENPSYWEIAFYFFKLSSWESGSNVISDESIKFILNIMERGIDEKSKLVCLYLLCAGMSYYQTSEHIPQYLIFTITELWSMCEKQIDKGSYQSQRNASFSLDEKESTYAAKALFSSVKGTSFSKSNGRMQAGEVSTSLEDIVTSLEFEISDYFGIAEFSSKVKEYNFKGTIGTILRRNEERKIPRRMSKNIHLFYGSHPDPSKAVQIFRKEVPVRDILVTRNRQTLSRNKGH